MFTGIITDIGHVRSVERRGDIRVVIATGFDTDTIDIGASIACSGPCLTVVDKGPDWFAVDVSTETMACTALDAWGPGARVNLERSLRVGEELGGHIVTGHVDGVGTIVGLRAEGGSLRMRVRMPAALAPFVAAKGAIAVDGISLTVNEVEADAVDGPCFGINIIPHTQEKTTLGQAVEGMRVNLEIDILARYISRLAGPHLRQAGGVS